MKYLTLILIACLTICSCSHKSSESSTFTDTTSLNKNALAQSDIDTVKINTNLPFGCIGLAKYKYPKHWDEDHEHYGRLKSPEGKELANISTLLHTINNSKTIIPPTINRIEYIDLNGRYKEDVFYFDTLAVRQMDSCVYRLPNIRGYQCYYYRQQTKKQTYGVYGSLLLLDPATRNGKLFTLYFEYGGDQNVKLRYYLIDKDTIHIYDGSCYDDGTTLAESFKIAINIEGKLEIREIKK